MDDVISKAMRNKEKILGPLAMPTTHQKRDIHKSGYTDERVTDQTFNSHFGYVLRNSNDPFNAQARTKQIIPFLMHQL